MKQVKFSELDNLLNNEGKKVFRLELFELADGSIVSLPVSIISNVIGPTVTIVAAQHGNEWNGPFACHLLYQLLELSKINGRIIILPIANPQAFLQKQRVSSLDNIDMNRTYAFTKKRKPTEHIAKIIFEEFCLKSDYVIDLHSGGPGEYIPLVEVLDPNDIKLAQSFNLDRVTLRNKDGNSLVPNCEKAGVKAFSIEAGRALKLNYDYGGSVAGGIINFLKTIKVINEVPETDFSQRIFTGKLTLPSEISGFYKPSVKLGQDIKKGEELCTIWPFFHAKPKSIISPIDGNIIYLRSEEVVSEGDSLAHIAE